MKKTSPVIWKFVLKIVGILILALLFFNLLFGVLDMVRDDDWTADTGRMVSICDREYYDRDFADLREFLELYELYSPEFDMYWEIADGYEDYLLWRQWERAAQMKLPNGEEQAARYAQKLRENLQANRFAPNAPILQGFVDQTQAEASTRS